MSNRLQKLRDKWSGDRLMSLRGVPRTASPDTVFNLALAADPTPNHKYLDWTLVAWESGKFLFEDIQAGADSKVADQLSRFETNKHRIADPAMRSLLKYKGPGELDAAMDEAGVAREAGFFDMSSNQQKKAMMIKARLESQHVETESGLQFDIPLSEFASNILGRNTRWCTAASKDNQFSEYAETGPLIIITLPGGRRFQAHCDLMEFMDLSEIRNSIEDAEVEEEEVDAEIILSSLMDSRAFTILNENDNKLDAEDLKELYPFRKEVFDFIGKAYTDIAEGHIKSYSDERYHKEFIQAYRDIVSTVFETHLFDDYDAIKGSEKLVKQNSDNLEVKREQVILNEENALDVLKGVIDARHYYPRKDYHLDKTVSLETRKRILRYLDIFDEQTPSAILDILIENINARDIKEIKAFIDRDINGEDLKKTMDMCFKREVRDMEIFKAYYDFDNLCQNERLEVISSLWDNKELNSKGVFYRDLKQLFLKTVLENKGYDMTQLSQNEKNYLGFKCSARSAIPFYNSQEFDKATITLAFDRSSAYSDDALNAILIKHNYPSDIVKEFPEDIQKSLFIMGKSNDSRFVKGLFMDGEYKEPSDFVLENRLSGERSLSSRLSPYLGLLSLESMEVLATGKVTPEICDEALARLERIIDFYRNDPIVKATIERIKHNEDVTISFHVQVANKTLDNISAKAREMEHIHQTVEEEKEILLGSQNTLAPQPSH